MKQIPINKKYIISKDGLTIVNTETKKTLIQSKQIINKNETGYLYVSLIKDNIVNRISVHRLVALTYIDNPLNLPEVHHIDNNRSNNNMSNLKWVSVKDNRRLRVVNAPKGVNHWNYGLKRSKLTKTKMSNAKLGTNHPKFKGYYIVNGNKYATPKEAEKYTGIKSHTIFRRCKNKYKYPNFSFLNVQ